MSGLRKERRDVARHREAILDAASHVFAEQGVHVSLDAVVEAAGVGRATLYRHFPDRAALLLALFEREMAAVSRASIDVEPGQALFSMIAQSGRAAREAPALADAWRAVAADHPQLRARQREFVRLFEAPLAAALSEGAVRPDLTISDVLAVIRMVIAASRQEDAEKDQTPSRALDLVLKGILRRDQ
ncbi:MAG: TetR/AcrR family transcriptional regulator [Alphaproteobacteria bacterium]|uniref:TetR/AcrR family transcriptional regulator n=1 Tax=Brevundimonas sp. BAL3 TaxID=391600 RepID=UPI00017EDBBC|nr:TetR/AcrR family transcriptional regulator [Brevundimonas sp. BAL3]EDX80110.1 transcriptional regulator, TetR family protein [Brevundimonas sp. BAL3]PZO09105.1 MAG: TetR/AcrR family transcriptional regulator [Alphaproteobacteria bacterium]